MNSYLDPRSLLLGLSNQRVGSAVFLALLICVVFMVQTMSSGSYGQVIKSYLRLHVFQRRSAQDIQQWANSLGVPVQLTSSDEQKVAFTCLWGMAIYFGRVLLQQQVAQLN